MKTPGQATDKEAGAGRGLSSNVRVQDGSVPSSICVKEIPAEGRVIS